jgi:hypothetical protein
MDAKYVPIASSKIVALCFFVEVTNSTNATRSKAALGTSLCSFTVAIDKQGLDVTYLMHSLKQWFQPPGVAFTVAVQKG